MKKTEVRRILMQEAAKCQRYADQMKQKEEDSDLVHYWVGKRRGFLDAVKYLDRIGDDE